MLAIHSHLVFPLKLFNFTKHIKLFQKHKKIIFLKNYSSLFISKAKHLHIYFLNPKSLNYLIFLNYYIEDRSKILVFIKISGFPIFHSFNTPLIWMCPNAFVSWSLISLIQKKFLLLLCKIFLLNFYFERSLFVSIKKNVKPVFTLLFYFLLLIIFFHWRHRSKKKLNKLN